MSTKHFGKKTSAQKQMVCLYPLLITHLGSNELACVFSCALFEWMISCRLYIGMASHRCALDDAEVTRNYVENSYHTRHMTLGVI